MRTAHAGHPMDDGWPLSQIVKASYQAKMQRSRRKQGKGKGQIWLIPSDGGEAHQLTFMPHGASNPTWSPDCKRMVFSAAVGPLDEETEDGKILPKVRVIDRLLYRLDGVGFIYERRQHLFLVDVDGGELETTNRWRLG